MDRSPSETRRLGVIIPGARPDGRRESQAYEVYHYGAWISEHGIRGVGVLNEVTVAEGAHLVHRAYETAAPEVILPAAKALGAAGCEAILWACTCASFVGGLEWAEEQAGDLARAAGVPATSTSLALVEAIRHLGADTVDVISPYPPKITGRLLALLTEAGIEVAALVTLDCLRPETSHGVDLHGAALRFDRALPPRRHPLLLPDTAVDGFPLVRSLEPEIGRPVIAANPATLWSGLRLLGIEPRAEDSGALFGPSLGPVGQHAAAD
ncbi:MAG: maleate cis-trans isomerase family protein [Alphaproteobacteria bacterium]